MSPEKIRTLYRRWRDGQTQAEIARNEGLDRKTTRKYLEMFRKAELDRIASGDGHLADGLEQIATANARPAGMRSAYEAFKQEIHDLIHARENPMKPKTAWEVLRQRHSLTASYSAFKRFVHRHDLARREKQPCLRIEVKPGEEAQIDYGKVGTILGPDGKRHAVYAFVAVLSYSRLMFIQFTFRQTVQSFVQSHVDLFRYLGGVPLRLVIDNLKSGVTSADYWDPEINHAYRELTEHYNTFVDPARVRTPQDKGKVERQVPVARELFRMLVNLHPAESIDQLSDRALTWLTEVHAERKNGTTGMAPRVLFEKEKAHLHPLPEEAFDVPLWKQAKVGQDRFIQFEGAFYALPQHVGEEVWLRKCRKTLQISRGGVFVRHYIIGAKHFNYLPGDLPPYEEAIQEGHYPAYLIQQARRFGCAAQDLMKRTLLPNAWMNARRGQAILRVLGKHCAREDFREVLSLANARRITHWRDLENLFEAEAQQMKFAEVVSEAQKELLHAPESYWLHSPQQGGG
jgi:transposase